jgi:hypothetical protein
MTLVDGIACVSCSSMIPSFSFMLSDSSSFSFNVFLYVVRYSYNINILHSVGSGSKTTLIDSGLIVALLAAREKKLFS